MTRLRVVRRDGTTYIVTVSGPNPERVHSSFGRKKTTWFGNASNFGVGTGIGNCEARIAFDDWDESPPRRVIVVVPQEQRRQLIEALEKQLQECASEEGP